MDQVDLSGKNLYRSHLADSFMESSQTSKSRCGRGHRGAESTDIEHAEQREQQQPCRERKESSERSAPGAQLPFSRHRCFCLTWVACFFDRLLKRVGNQVDLFCGEFLLNHGDGRERIVCTTMALHFWFSYSDSHLHRAHHAASYEPSST